ncbi:MAG: cation:proton antiporter regulatory subunit [Acidimicrobiia bacterium]
MNSDITEQDLPGIGRSYTVAGTDGSRVLVVLHHSGRRDLYVLPDDEDDDPTAIVTFSDDQARRLGSILAGAYFKPAAIAQVEAVIGGLLIDWATVRADSPGLEQSIEALAIRRQTRMTVAAIVHADGSSVVAPEPHEVLRLGDQLVVVGRPEDLPAFLHLVIG